METIQAQIADLKIGSGSPIVVQTMCNTHTSDVEASVSQCIRLAKAGAQMIRLTVPSMAQVESLREIKARLLEEGIDVPLVADVHFSAEIALAAAQVVEKVRINPGNFHKDHEKAQEMFAELVKVCKTNGTAVRIGLNHGSLGERITNLYGNTPLAMKEAVMEWLDMCIENDFYNVVVSLKASNTIVMVEAYRLLAKAMQEKGVVFPLHLGVTEAGNGDAGRIKSAVGISALLAEGDTALSDFKQATVYLRDPADFKLIEPVLHKHLAPDALCAVVRGAVCRPGWLVEIEGIAVKDNGNCKFKPFV